MNISIHLNPHKHNIWIPCVHSFTFLQHVSVVPFHHHQV